MNVATKTGAEEVTWDLSDLYSGPDDPRIETDAQQALADARAFRDRYHGTVGALDAAGLAEAVGEQERISSAIARVAAFASLRFSTDTADPARGAALQKVRELGAKISTELLFFTIEWLAVDDARASSLLADGALATHRHHLASLRRYVTHTLTEPEERILTEKAVTGSSAWSRLFTELTSSTKVRLDGDDLSMEQAMSRLQRPDRDVRKAAFEAITEALQPGLRTRAFVFNTLLHDKAVDDRLRGYASWIAARNLSNEASDASVQALVDAVTARYDIPHRYYKLKARLLGLDTLADYDRNAPVGAGSATLSWDEARTLVTGAYEAFSPRAGHIIDDFFARRWIDAAPGENKSGGAYCATTIPGRHPFVFMTYTGERRSVLTLAHELGHALHGTLAGHHGYYNAGTPLTLAETASVFGEALTFKRLLSAETDRTERLALITSRIDDTIGTVFRQIAMNRFEDAVHTARRERGEQSVDDLSAAWMRTQTDVLGDGVAVTDAYRTWWSYIPHFIGSPGYVYAYAFGYLFSLAIFRRYETEGASMVEPYLQLLSAGGSDSPETLARLVGLDLSDPGFWDGGLRAVDELLAEAEDLAR